MTLRDLRWPIPGHGQTTRGVDEQPTGGQRGSWTSGQGQSLQLGREVGIQGAARQVLVLVVVSK